MKSVAVGRRDDMHERRVLLAATAWERRRNFSTRTIGMLWWLCAEPPVASGEQTAQVMESAAYAWSTGPRARHSNLREKGARKR